MDLRDQRETYNGFGEGLSRAFEFAVTPAIFGFVGHLVDGHFHTSPIFMLATFVVSVVGMFVRLWYAYDADMKVHEERRDTRLSATEQGMG